MKHGIARKRRLQIWKSLGWASQETGAPVGSGSQATKLIRFCPYGARLVHEFKCFGALQGIQFFNWILKNIHDGLGRSSATVCD